MKIPLLLNDWIFTKDISPDARTGFVSVYLKYPDWKLVVKSDLKDRKKFIDDFHKAGFKKLADTGYFEAYELIGTKKRPRGVKARVAFDAMLKLAKKPFVESILIDQLDGARKKVKKQINSFFCVKMTVSIQVEGFTKGMQSYEERYVLVRAANPEDAYRKVSKREKQYGEPYLNSDARLARWKIESYDDCFCTDITSLHDFEAPEGVEIFSKLGRRKIKEHNALDWGYK